MNEIIVNKDLEENEILRLLEKEIKIGQVILLGAIMYKRVRREVENNHSAFIKLDNYNEDDYITIKRNTDKNIIMYRRFANLQVTSKYISIYSSENRVLKYELTSNGYIVYKNNN